MCSCGTAAVPAVCSKRVQNGTDLEPNRNQSGWYRRLLKAVCTQVKLWLMPTVGAQNITESPLIALASPHSIAFRGGVCSFPPHRTAVSRWTYRHVRCTPVLLTAVQLGLVPLPPGFLSSCFPHYLVLYTRQECRSMYVEVQLKVRACMM